jgi:hypothetical protein
VKAFFPVNGKIKSCFRKSSTKKQILHLWHGKIHLLHSTTGPVTGKIMVLLVLTRLAVGFRKEGSLPPSVDPPQKLVLPLPVPVLSIFFGAAPT